MQDIFRSQFRLPADLADKLRDVAEANNRSMNAEIVARLEGSFSSRAASSDTQLAMDTYIATLENQALMADMRIQMASMQLASLQARTHHLVHKQQKDVSQMTNEELDATDREIEELKDVKAKISKLHMELREIRAARDSAQASILSVRAAIRTKVKNLEDALVNRPKQADSF